MKGLQKFKAIMGVSMPFALGFAAFFMLLIVGIGGLGFDLMGPVFKVDITKLSIPPTAFTDLTMINITSTENLTASSLGLEDKYLFYLWSYSHTPSNGSMQFEGSNFDYANKLDTQNISINGAISELPSKLKDIQSNFGDKMKFAQMVFLAAIFNAFLVVLLGVLACFSIKFRLLVGLGFAGITFLTMIAFAVLITMAGLNAPSNLKPFIEEFDGKVDTGISDLAIVWMAAAHMLAVVVMFTLMATGVRPMNPAFVQPSKLEREEDLLRGDRTGDYSLVHVTHK
ncbi:hypothetical protein BJ875DRAFT_476219 [Amylocarpus encephaloides]|uniref:Uncharacterized protein n=1 Tax=Amylocarpus encephaloides TaxID=45428 RepID=A0A9P8C0K8_9HELO|nr:hypothetical protein BJ875DRAFT_476219 [Amylocarpus encephaloides]